MKKNDFLSLGFLTFVILIFFRSFFLQGKVPIPTDTLVNLFHPFRDYYAKEYPRGIPYKNPLVGDPINQQIPWKDLAINLMKDGQLPLWNPYQMAGYPLLGNIQSAPVYPFNLILSLFPFVPAWSFFIMLQQLLGAFFMYMYLRNRGLSYEGSILGGLSFSFSGFMISWLEWGTIAHTAIWLPFMLLAVDKLVLKKYRWSVGLVGGLGSSYLAGHLQTFLYSFGIVIAYFVFRYLSTSRSKKVLLVAGGAVIMTVLITFPIWFSQLQFIGLSARTIDQNWHQEGWFIPLAQSIQFLAPDFFGNPATGNYFGVWNYGEFIGYVGIFPLLLVFVTLMYKKHKDVVFWSGIACIALLFAFQTPLAKIPYTFTIPFLSSTQPTRLLFVVDSAFSILAAMGIDTLRKQKRSVLLPQTFLILLLVGAAVFGFFSFRSGAIDATNWHVIKRNLVLPMLLVFLFAFFTFVVSRVSVQRKKYVIFTCLFITSLDLLFFANKYTPFAKKEYFYPTTKVIEYLKNQPGLFRIMSVDRRILHPNISTKYRLQSIDGYDPLYLLRYGELMAASGRRKPDISAPFGFFRIVTPNDFDTQIINLLGVSYVLSLSDINHKYLKKVFEEGETKVYRNLNAFPRAFFVKNVIQAGNKYQAISLMFNPKVNLRRSAIVEDTDDFTNEDFFTQGTVEIVSYTENKIVLSTKNRGKGFLILTDTYYPTWKVTVDGKEQEIYRTDYNFRGVVVPKGNHTVEFKNTLL